MEDEAMSERGYDISRYAAAALLLLYGFAKVTGAQFTVPESELDKPLREVSGFWLTWYYFGYSPIYGNLIALVQIAGAIGLMLQRTALIAACVLFLVIGNIILIDVFFGIDLQPLIVAILIEALLFRVLLQHKERLAQLWLPATSSTRPIIHALRVALVLFAFGATYWIANYNNRLPTEIDGVWDGPVTVYFERNRAYMCVFRFPDGRTSTHHFEVDEQQNSVQIWERWLTKGPLLYRGTYDGKRMELSGATRLTLTARVNPSP